MRLLNRWDKIFFIGMLISAAGFIQAHEGSLSSAMILALMGGTLMAFSYYMEL